MSKIYSGLDVYNVAMKELKQTMKEFEGKKASGRNRALNKAEKVKIKALSDLVALEALGMLKGKRFI